MPQEQLVVLSSTPVAAALAITETSNPGRFFESSDVKMFARVVWQTLTEIVPAKHYANAMIVSRIGTSFLGKTVCATITHCCKVIPALAATTI
jgi:hypothetical protein